MNRQDIEHMWKVASNDPNHDTNWHDPVVIRFAELVRKDYSTTHANLWLDRINKFVLEEREGCEALHDHEDVQAPIGNSSWGEAYQEGWAQGTAAYRDAIKARGSHE